MEDRIISRLSDLIVKKKEAAAFEGDVCACLCMDSQIPCVSKGIEQPGSIFFYLRSICRGHSNERILREWRDEECPRSHTLYPSMDIEVITEA